MKHFVIFIVKILGLLLLLALALDFCYTAIFTHSVSRNKVEFVWNSPPQNYDVVFLGTSRANNHFVAPLFEEQGISAYNFGMSGSHLFEASLLLKKMLANKWQLKNCIIETDLNLSNEKRDDGTFARFMPFLHQDTLVAQHIKHEPDFNALYYVPFYRYIRFDAKIGTRACYKTLLQEPTNTLSHLGYYALGHNPKANMKNDIRNLKPLRNKYYEEIKALCKANGIQLIAVTTPMCSNVKGRTYFEKVQKIYPEIIPMEHYVRGDAYFSSCGHLNDAGAKLFTGKVLKTLKDKLNK